MLCRAYLGEEDGRAAAGGDGRGAAGGDGRGDHRGGSSDPGLSGEREEGGGVTTDNDVDCGVDMGHMVEGVVPLWVEETRPFTTPLFSSRRVSTGQGGGA
eukprot:6422600-Pyramimonas_sp.AAC.1